LYSANYICTSIRERECLKELRNFIKSIAFVQGGKEVGEGIEGGIGQLF
jgi:hypothetical protein